MPRQSVLSSENVKDLGDQRSDLLSLEMDNPKLRVVMWLFRGAMQATCGRVRI